MLVTAAFAGEMQHGLMLWHVVSQLCGQTKGNDNGYLQLTCLMLSMKRDNMKLPPSVIDYEVLGLEAY